LLARIQAFGFSAADDPLGFESRLADDNGWTLGYALAVAEEYRRFLVLTQVAGHAASPSADVDQAWHLHLTRTLHYERFCTETFGRFLHHEPARSGQGPRHREMYRQTCAAYRRAFGTAAPAPIWPAPDKPVDPGPVGARGWSVPHELRRGHRLAVVAALVAIVAALGLRNLGWLAPLQEIAPMTFLGVALLLTGALGWLGLRDAPARPDAMRRDVLEPYEAAWLSGGAERMAMTAIVALTERGVLLAPGRASERGARPPIPVDMTREPRCVHPAEVACLRVVADGGVRFSSACRGMLPLADEVERRLIAAGIASDVTVLPPRRARALLALVVLLVVELERIFHALGTTHRIGFLVMLTLAGMALMVALARRTRRTGARAERVLRPLRLAAGRYRRAPPAGQALAFGVALIGATAMADDLRFDGLRQQVNVAFAGVLQRRVASRRDDASCGSSCSACGSDAGSGSGDGGGSSGSCGSSCSSGCGGGGGSGGD